jgi:hypothetical protein
MYYIPKLRFARLDDKNNAPLLVGDKAFLTIGGILLTPIYGLFSIYDDINRLQAIYDKTIYPNYKEYYEKKVFPYSLTRNYICKDTNIMS